MFDSHLGHRSTLLVDGRLSAAEEARCWRHLDHCPSCRDQLAREGWVKQRLAGLAAADQCVPQAGPTLHDHLKQVGSTPGVARVPAYGLGTRSPRMSVAGMSALSAGSLSVALLGVLAIGAPAQAPNMDRRTPTGTQQVAVTGAGHQRNTPAVTRHAGGFFSPRIAAPAWATQTQRKAQ